MRAVDIDDDINRYEILLEYARSKVDFPVPYGVNMLPSNMLVRLGDVEGYNYSTKLAGAIMRIGVNSPHVPKSSYNVTVSHLLHATNASISLNVKNESISSNVGYEHEEEKTFYLFYFGFICPWSNWIISWKWVEGWKMLWKVLLCIQTVEGKDNLNAQILVYGCAD